MATVQHTVMVVSRRDTDTVTTHHQPMVVKVAKETQKKLLNAMNTDVQSMVNGVDGADMGNVVKNVAVDSRRRREHVTALHQDTVDDHVKVQHRTNGHVIFKDAKSTVIGRNTHHMENVRQAVEEVYKNVSDIVTVHHQPSVERNVKDSPRLFVFATCIFAEVGLLGEDGEHVPYHVVVAFDSVSETVTLIHVLVLNRKLVHVHRSLAEEDKRLADVKM